MKTLPKARTENIVVQTVSKETLVYDLNTHRAFNLNETLTTVYKSCDGRTTFEELERKHKFTNDFIFLALDELKSGNLLDDVSYQSPFADINRRDVIKRVGLATVFMLPLIAGLVAPKAIDAASGTVAPNDPSSRIEAPCDRSRPPTCVNSGGYCTDTASGPRCCNNTAGGLNLFLSGQTSSSSEQDFRQTVLPVNAPREDTTTCPSIIQCCDGRAANGSTTYTLDRLLENDPQRAFFTISFSCTCP